MRVKNRFLFQSIQRLIALIGSMHACGVSRTEATHKDCARCAETVREKHRAIGRETLSSKAFKEFFGALEHLRFA
ncbi:MAG TPA: hypothetical protein VNE00_15605 [Paraburkholderia sp.]|jgi:hypothetical protein|nr:hypothetical protein [Paraburkholderia sp.]